MGVVLGPGGRKKMKTVPTLRVLTYRLVQEEARPEVAGEYLHTVKLLHLE